GGLKDQSMVQTFVSSDIVELGRNSARALLRAIGPKGGTVFYQRSLPDQTFFDQLQAGWDEIMKQHPNVHQLTPVYSEFDVSKARSEMEAILAAHPDVVGGFVG